MHNAKYHIRLATRLVNTNIQYQMSLLCATKPLHGRVKFDDCILVWNVKYENIGMECETVRSVSDLQA